MRLLLIRHGETERNADGRALGREDVPLNERGRRQASALAVAFGERASHGAIAAVYSSPLQRALATASAIAEAAGLAVAQDDRLIEMAVGEMEDLPMADLQARDPDFLRRWRDEDEVADVVMPGGESLRQVQARAWPAIEELRDRHVDETIAVVSHNFVILTLLCRALDLPLGRFRRLKQDLAAISIVEATPARTQVLAMNDRAHLRDA